jgi:hypothetical protein
VKKRYLINQFTLRFVPAQEKMEGWIMDEVAKGVGLPGLHPMNAETKVPCEAWAKEKRPRERASQPCDL